MKKLIIVADWAADTLTNQEVKTAVEGALESTNTANISFVASFPSTINTSYIIRQVVAIESRYGRPSEAVLFENTDPRMQTKKSVEKAQGADFIVIKLKSGMYLCGPNAGYDFTLIKDQIEKVWIHHELNKGSQFRSRDLYAKVCAHLMEGKEAGLSLEEVDSSIIPDLDGSYIGHIDNYGNIKTTIKLNDVLGKNQYGDMITVTINHVTKEVKFVNNLFGGVPGELVIYPGSSGDKENPDLEISIWRHFTEEDKTTGLHAFNEPHPGERIELQ